MLHDLENGQISRCQICLSPDLKLVLDLGYHPPCDSLLTSDQLKEPEITYPLRLVCDLLQEAGFNNPHRYDWQDTDFAEYDDYSQAYLPHMDKANGILMSLNLKSVK